MNSANFIGLLGGLNEKMHMKCSILCLTHSKHSKNYYFLNYLFIYLVALGVSRGRQAP